MKKINVLTVLFSVLLLACNIATAQERMVEIIKGGEVIYSVPSAEIDYMTVSYRIPAPGNMQGAVKDEGIKITWDAVEGATQYKVYRSADGENFTWLTSTANTYYTDQNPLDGNNYYRIQAIGANNSKSDFAQTGTPYRFSALQSGLYMGIIGFNSKLYRYPVSILNSESKAGFEAFIDKFDNKIDGTLLYYSVEQAISTLQACNFPEDLSNVAIVTFTDGLDDGSHGMTSAYDEADDPDEAYMQAINNRIKTETVSNLPISAYAIGIRGGDVVDVAKFSKNLKMIASADSLAYEVTDMNQVKEKFQEIADKLNDYSYIQALEFRTQVQANRTRIRLTLDGTESDASASKIFIEGTFNKSDNSLIDITYSGLTSTSGDRVVGTLLQGGMDEASRVIFKIEGIQTGDKKLIAADRMHLHKFISSTSKWQPMSEFSPDEDSKLNVEQQSAAIMLVLDCSKSLGEKLAEVKSNAKSFINTLCHSVESNPDDPTYVNPSVPEGFVDLGLSVKWAECNLGATTASGYGNYYAWGETSTKSDYSSSTSTTYNKSLSTLKSSGIVDANGNLTANYDVAQKLGKGRMPTKAEQDELRTKCTWTWTSLNGVNGYRVTGPNGNSIFLPAAGYRSGSSSSNVGSYGDYWSSTAYDNSDYAYGLYFYSSDYDWDSYYGRCYGLSVRPVTE